MLNIKRNVSTFKDRLIKISDNEPLSKLSLIVIIALDIFILTVLFQGLAEHTRQLTSPYEYVSYQCRQALIKHDWTGANRLTQLQELVLADHGDYAYRQQSIFDDEHLNQMHPICREFYAKIALISHDDELVGLFKQRKKLIEEKQKFSRSFKKNKDVYDTSLLENIADPAEGRQLDTIAAGMKSKAKMVESYNAKILAVEKQIAANPLVLELWKYIDANHKPTLLEDLKKFEFRYPFIILLWQFLFLLPLFIVFYIWNTRSIKKDSTLQILISSHLLVIVSIPILFKIIEITLDLIPHHFFKNLFNLLKSLHIIALWHYFLIVGSIGAALLTIYIIQKKIFNKRRLELKRLMKGSCYICGKKLPENSCACPFCGKLQLKTCEFCHNKMYVAGEYCNTCGTRAAGTAIPEEE